MRLAAAPDSARQETCSDVADMNSAMSAALLLLFGTKAISRTETATGTEIQPMGTLLILTACGLWIIMETDKTPQR